MDILEDHVVSPEECVSQEGLQEKVASVRDSPKQKAFSLVQTVRKNMEGYTKHEIKDASLARKAQAILAHPSDR